MFLRKKGMEREAIRKKEKLEKPPATPTTPALIENSANVLRQATATTPANGSDEVVAIVERTKNKSRSPVEGVASSEQPGGQHFTAEAQMDIPRPSIEVRSPFHFIRLGSNRVLSPQRKTTRKQLRWTIKKVSVMRRASRIKK